MKDGALRRSIKFAARVITAANLHGTRALWRLRGERPYKLGGSCEKCAACCESPSIQVGRLTWHLPTMRRLFLWYHRVVNGFILKDRDPRQRVFVFECTHFDRTTRRCDSYSSRPLMCRDYPRALLWGPNPRFLTGCGYRAVSCNAAAMIEALRAEGIEGDRLEELKDRMHLRE